MRTASLILAAALSQISCMLCPSGVTLGEKAVPVCDGIAYDEMRGRSYRLVRIQGEVRTRARFTFNLQDNCEVDHPEDLSRLGVQSIFIQDPRSDPVLVLRTSKTDQQGRPIDCRAPLSESEAMGLACPAEAGDLSYLVEPLE
jgi:hypothetical protein